MIRHNSTVTLIAAVLMAVLVSTALGDADGCLWCDSKMAENFLNCVCSQIKNNPIFRKVSSGALDDMKNGLMAASQAVVKSSESMKMEMMTGAMAGELSGLMKSQYMTGDSKEATSAVLETVGDCYATTTGQSHYGFKQGVEKIVLFLINKEEKPSYDDPVSETKSAPPQYPAQASASSVALAKQNVLPPNYYHAPPLKPSFTLPVPNNLVSNRKYTPQSPPFYPNAGLFDSEQLAGGQGKANAASLIYKQNKRDNALYIRPSPNVQPQSTQTNAASNSYSFQPNKRSNFAHATTVQQNSDAASSSTIFGVNTLNVMPGQIFPQSKGLVSNSAASYAINGQRNPPNYVNEPVSIPAPSYANNPQRNRQSFVNGPVNNADFRYVNKINPLNSITDNRVYPSNHVNNSPTQSVQSTAGASSYNEPKPKYDYNSNYPPEPRSYDNHQPYYDYGSKYPSQLSSNNKPPPNYDNNSDNLKTVISPDTTSGGGDGLRSQPTNEKSDEVTNGKSDEVTNGKSDEVTNEKSDEVTNENNFQRSGDDGDAAKALAFAETIYVKYAESLKFRSTFNKRTSNKKAASCIYKTLLGALKRCGYSKFAEEIASACSDEIKSLPEKSTFAEYGETISKSLMDKLYKKNMIGENPEDQARCIADAFLSRLKKKKSSRSSKSATSTAQFSSSTVTPYTESSDYGQDNSDNSEIPSDYAQDGGKSQGDHYYQYNGDYPTSQKNKRLKNQTPKKKGSKNKYYYDYPTSRTKTGPIQRPTGEKPNLAQKGKPNYNKTPGSNGRDDDSNERQKSTSAASASANSSSATYQGREDKAKKKKANGRKRANDKPVANNGSHFGSSNAGENQDYSETDPQQNTSLATTYDTTSTQPQQDPFPDSTSENDGGSIYSESQTNPDNEKVEKHKRIHILIKWALSSISDGKFNHKVYSSVIAALAKFLQTRHPEWGSQECLIAILCEALIALTHLMSKVPPECFNEITASENIDEAVASWSRSSAEQNDHDSMQMSEKNKTQNDQSYDEQQIPEQESYWNREYPTQQGNSFPPSETSNTKQGSGNISPDSNSNAPPKDNTNNSYVMNQRDRGY